MVTLYRSGGLPTVTDLQTKSAVWFDEVARKLQLDVPSPRTSSVFACVTLEEAEGWVEWREDKGLDSTIWEIKVPENQKVYAHKVRTYEDARFIYSLMTSESVKVNADPEDFVTAYWDDKILVTEDTVLSSDYFWEVLLPYETAQVSKWNQKSGIYS